MRKFRSLFIATALAAVWPLSSGAAINPGAIVLAMDFDVQDGDIAVDGSANANHGTLVEDADWAKGQLGGAVKLRNTAHIEVPSSESLVLSNSDLTMALWFSFSQTPAWTTLLSHDVGAAIGDKKWSLYYTNGRFRFALAPGGGDPAWADSDFFEDPVIDQWYHVAVVKVGDACTFYLDGEPYGVDETDVDVPEGMAPPLTIGCTKERYHLQGKIDEVLITKQALTEGDVRKHMDRGVGAALTISPAEHLATTWAAVKSR